MSAPKKEPEALPRAVIFGATGAQGGSVVDALIRDGTYDVVAVTRDPESEKAKKLAEDGCEVVKADMDDKASCELAVKGADVVFLVTNYWEIFDEKKEEQQAKNVIDACKTGNVGFLVFSTLEDVGALNAEGMSCGKIDVLPSGSLVPHFDAKGRAMAYCKEQDIKACYLKLSFYMENWTKWFIPVAKKDKFFISYPLAGKPMGVISVEDVGGIVSNLFKNADKYAGKEIGAAAELVTGDAIAAAFSEVFGKTVVFEDAKVAQYKSQDFPGAGEFGNMFQAYQDTEKILRSPEETKAIYGQTVDMKTWLLKNKDNAGFAELNK